MISSPNLASRQAVYRHYDTEVQGAAVMRPGEGDAGIIAPLEIELGCPAGIALSVDGNPFIGEVDPYWGGAAAVAEAMRNVAAVGAIPRALTDCLNYGNPEKPQAFYQFEQGVRGISDAARHLWQFDTPEEPVPIVSGNVSFYNESAQGKAIKPSPVVACYGIIPDYSRAVTSEIKTRGSRLILVGARRDEMGGSALYREIYGVTGKTPLTVRWESERRDIHAVIELIHAGLVNSCHDISDGGLGITLAEMCIGQEIREPLGMNVSFDPGRLSPETYLFCENGGFVLEIPPAALPDAASILDTRKCEYIELGETTAGGRLKITCTECTLTDIDVTELRTLWRSKLEEILS